MAISNLNDYVGASKQHITFTKTASRATISGTSYSVFDMAGQPSTGVLAGTDAVSGVVPTDAVAGYPTINPFGASATGYLSGVAFASSVACRVSLYDRLYVAGAFPFNANVTLTTQPSFASRVPDADYKGLQIWIETVTSFTGNLTVAVTYTNELGQTGHTTGTFALGSAPLIGRCLQLPLQAGDNGVQKIESVVSTVATIGTFNVMVLRPLWEGRVRSACDGDTHDFLKTGLADVYADSALYTIVTADSSATGIPSLSLEVANA